MGSSAKGGMRFAFGGDVEGPRLVVGGRVVVGDEGIAPWHRQSEYGAILMNSNPLYKHEPPLDLLPETVREASVRWLIGNAFYVIAFRVGAGLPDVDLDLPIKGGRGGTHRTRYYGRLEGVTPDAALKAILERTEVPTA